MLSDYIYTWLNNSLDYGITEEQFWQMTIAELERAINSKKRVEIMRAREKASYDYILADLIGRSISRMYSSANTMPEIYTVYPTLFESTEIQEKKQEQQAELSAIRFKLFAKSYNDRFKNKEVQKVNE